MATNEKKPSLDEFVDFLRKTGGNLTQTAGIMGVSRQTIHRWMREDEEFKAAVQNERKALFDKCLDVSSIVALGVPILDPQTGAFMGWRERPDGNMLRYLMSTLGRDEGFGEQTTVSLDNPLPTVINIIRDKDPETSE